MAESACLSFFQCQSCCFYEETIMHPRASASRRSLDNTSDVALRSRSVERSKDDDGCKKNNQSVDRMPIQRSMSDPFDTQEDAVTVGISEESDENSLATSRARTMSRDMNLASMPRYPHQESKDRNSFSEPPVSIFSVRGPNYFQDKKKVTSGPYMLPARGCDLLLVDENQDVDLSERTRNIMGGQLRKRPTLAINFKFPWGYMNLYFEVPDHLSPYMSPSVKPPSGSSFTPAETSLIAWLQGDQEYRNERLKLIPFVAEGPWVVRNMVTGRPAIIGKKLPVSYNLMVGTESEAPLLMATLDIGSSSATAKRIVSVCRRYMSSLTVDIGFVIQAEELSQLPEQMMGSIRVHHADPLKAPKL